MKLDRVIISMHTFFVTCGITFESVIKQTRTELPHNSSQTLLSIPSWYNTICDFQYTDTVSVILILNMEELSYTQYTYCTLEEVLLLHESELTVKQTHSS